jgi:hypothetical protein
MGFLEFAEVLTGERRPSLPERGAKKEVLAAVFAIISAPAKKFEGVCAGRSRYLSEERYPDLPSPRHLPILIKKEM